jgi:hypothetical protein
MTEFLTVVTGLIVLTGVAMFAYLMGRDAAERKAQETVSDLRRATIVLRRQRDRAIENNARLARFIGANEAPDEDTPSWMR